MDKIIIYFFLFLKRNNSFFLYFLIKRYSVGSFGNIVKLSKNVMLQTYLNNKNKSQKLSFRYTLLSNFFPNFTFKISV